MAKKEKQLDIFEHLELHNPGGEKEVKEEKKEEVKGEGVNIDALTAEIAGLGRRLDDMSAMNQALATNQGRQQVEQPLKLAEVPELDLSDLPDPVNDPSKYSTALQKKITDHTKATTAYEKAQTTALQKEVDAPKRNPDALWQDFRDEYPDLAKFDDIEDMAGIVGAQLAKKAQERGRDVDAYIYTGKQFLHDVADGVKQKYAKFLEDPKEDGKEEEEEEGDATVFGGETGHRGKKSGGKAEDVTDFSRDLSDLQRKSGYY